MSRGLFVYELDGKEYFLTKSESDEVEKFSNSEPDDGKYNEWFLDYVKQNNIPPKADKSRSAYWSRISYGGDNIARMATIQRAATTLIRVASPEVKASDVSFNQEPTSAVNLANEKDMQITLPVGPIKGDNLHEDIDAIAGFGLHEAYHLKYTSRVLNSPIRDAIASKGLEGLLYNFIEDIRVNDLGNEDNPGFAHYLDEAFDRIYKEDAQDYQMPAEWPLDDGRIEPAKLAAERLAALLSPIQYGKYVGDGSDKPYYDKVKKADKIVRDYAAVGEYATSNQLRTANQALRDIVDVVLPQSQPVETPVPLTMDQASAGDKGSEESEDIAAAAAAGLEESDLTGNEFAQGAGFGDATITKVRPVLKPPTSWNIIGKMPNEVLKADALLRLTKTRDRNEDRYMRSGDLDEDELYRLYAGDDRVFIDVTEEVEEEAVIYMCVDSSSSMSSAAGDYNPWEARRQGLSTDYVTRTRVATQLAWLLAHSMSKKKHVHTKVFAHTSGVEIAGVPNGIYGPGTIVYNVFEKGESFDRLDWLVNMAQGGTPDQVALAVIGKEILQNPATSKYIIMLNDGTPGSEGGGQSGPLEVRAVVDALTRKGVNVIQIGISKGLHPNQQSQMYNHWVHFKSVDQTIKDLAKILEKVR